MSDGVASRLRQVREAIDAACARAGRAPSGVRLVAVSKRHGVEAIREAYAAGQRDFGENYAQELAEKARLLADLPELRWHFIGHLQRNKVPQILPSRCTLHTLDSGKLAETLERRLPPEARPMPVLVQVNVAAEAGKAGVRPDELPALLEGVARLPRLRVQGLMLIAPEVADPEQARPHFRALAALARAHGLGELSMGMSGDMLQAIEEGATLVRVGTAIFGAR